MSSPSPARALATLLLGAVAYGAPLVQPTPRQGVQEGEPPAIADSLTATGALELSLQQALELALRNSLGLRIAEVETEDKSYVRLGSWGDYEWDFTATGRYVDAEREVTSTFLSGGATIQSTNEILELDFNRPLQTGGAFNVNFNTDRQTTNSVIANATKLWSDVLGVTLTQPLRRGAWREYTTAIQRQREIEWRLQVEAQRNTRADLVSQVETAYWDLVVALELRDVANSALELGLELLEKRQRELDAGVGTEVEVTEANADVATRIESLLQSENTVEQAFDDLKLLLFGEADPEMLDLPLVPTTGLPQVAGEIQVPEWGSALVIATEMRSELRQKHLAVDLARIAHQRTLSERLAGLDLALTASSGSVDQGFGDALSESVQWDFPTWTVQLVYNMPLGNKRADYAERSARALVQRALLDYDQTELTVVADVRRAVRDLKYRAEAVRAAEQTLVLAERQLAAERARNEQGLSTNYQVLEVQQRLVEAMSSERRARAEFAKARTALKAAQGLLGEEGLVP